MRQETGDLICRRPPSEWGHHIGWERFCRVDVGEIGHRVLEFQECLWYIFGHVEAGGAGGIVPVDVDAAKEGAVPVDCNGVVFFEGSLEMENMFM